MNLNEDEESQFKRVQKTNLKPSNSRNKKDKHVNFEQEENIDALDMEENHGKTIHLVSN